MLRISSLILALAIFSGARLPDNSWLLGIQAEDPLPRESSPESAAGVPDNLWLLKIQREDPLARAEFSAQFEVFTPRTVFFPEMGPQTGVGKVTAAAGALGLSVAYHYAADPPFQPLETARRGWQRGYDRDGNFIVIRPLQRFVLHTPDFSRSHVQNEWLRIAPDGRVVERGISPLSVHETRVRDSDHHHLVNWHQFQFAVGLGFSEHLVEVHSESFMAEGVRRLAVRPFKPYEKSCQLVVQEDAGGMMLRDALAWRLDPQVPSWTLKNRGRLESDGYCFAEIATLTLPEPHGQGLVREFRTIEFCLQPEMEHLEDLRGRMSASLPAGTDVWDFSGPTYRRYEVP
jgi:hypothetical protein